MPKLKTHKGIKKRFKVSATGKVSHKRCGSSHLMSHKSGKQVRRLRKKSILKISAEAHGSAAPCASTRASQPDADRGGQARRPGRAGEAEADRRRHGRRQRPDRPRPDPSIRRDHGESPAPGQPVSELADGATRSRRD